MSRTAPIGEVWVLSDRDNHPSRLADDDLQGCTLLEVSMPVPS